jgi:pyruvate ferredoxin oxidoreductase gamma subunit
MSAIKKENEQTLKEITIFGRGGQGAVTSAYVLAKAAFYDGKYSQAFPFFGVERRGAPVMSFCRINDKPILLREQVHNPDYMIILDKSLLNEKIQLKDSGTVIINTHENLQLNNYKTVCMDITKISLEIIGKPFVNIPILGVFAAFTNIVSLDSLLKSIDEMFASKGEVAELNKKATEIVFNETKTVVDNAGYELVDKTIR